MKDAIVRNVTAKTVLTEVCGSNMAWRPWLAKEDTGFLKISSLYNKSVAKMAAHLARGAERSALHKHIITEVS